MKYWRDKILLIVSATALIFVGMIRLSWGARLWQALKLPGPSPSAQAVGPTQETRNWRDIGRHTVISNSFEIANVLLWTVKPSSLPPNIKVSLRGRFTASEPMAFVVMDAENVARMDAGYPPLLAYGIGENQEIDTPMPSPGSKCGFVRPAAQRPQGIPLSLSELALRLAGQIAEQNRPPARVTLELRAEGRCFCTEAEAQQHFSK